MEIKSCKKCNIQPEIKPLYDYISIKCPMCGRQSNAHESHGMDVAIADWNTYHGKETHNYGLAKSTLLFN